MTDEDDIPRFHTWREKHNVEIKRTLQMVKDEMSSGENLPLYIYTEISSANEEAVVEILNRRDWEARWEDTGYTSEGDCKRVLKIVAGLDTL